MRYNEISGGKTMYAILSLDLTGKVSSADRDNFDDELKNKKWIKMDKNGCKYHMAKKIWE